MRGFTTGVSSDVIMHTRWTWAIDEACRRTRVKLCAAPDDPTVSPGAEPERNQILVLLRTFDDLNFFCRHH
jgi:hypothetical protein